MSGQIVGKDYLVGSYSKSPQPEAIGPDMRIDVERWRYDALSEVTEWTAWKPTGAMDGKPKEMNSRMKVDRRDTGRQTLYRAQLY
ncbi:hypothetical protein INT45_013987 [Circinella minor]|uniref:Uncharacterized protein n=1 Tax=Circinella minor TaxID=1195481 RepID=A0A8H7V7W8_9FUNG|nr:hypothetical protein INT45_013987 [Circinella minor]